MRKHLKLFTSTLVALLLSLLIATPAFASVYYEKSQTTYLSGINQSGYGTVYFGGYAKGKGIVKSSVKSSNTGVVVPTTLSSSTTNNMKLSKNGYSGKSYSDSISLTLKKPGTAKIKFKAGGKSYTSTVVVKKYVNPVKSLTVAGVSSGKNLSSKFKTSASVEGKGGKKAGKITLAAISGWKVRSISFYDEKTGRSYSIYANDGASKLTLNVPVKMAKGTVSFDIYNTKNGGTIYCHYELQ